MVLTAARTRNTLRGMKPKERILLSGPPGTGKSEAIQKLAAQRGMEVHRVNLSSVAGKLIGETEKNLQAVLSAAEKANAVLLLEEADALLGKRTEVKDSHDRYANAETTVLLELLESHGGIVALTTAREPDPALARRFRREG